MLKIIKLSAAVVVLALFAFSQPTMAAERPRPQTDREFADIYSQCGLGGMIAPKAPIVAIITNVTSDLGTTAILSNMSSPENCHGTKLKTAAFIFDSYVALEKDLASGNGKYLDTLTAIAGCKPQVHQELTDMLRNDFVKIVADPNYTEQSRFEKAKGLYDLLYKDINANFSGSCS